MMSKPYADVISVKVPGMLALLNIQAGSYREAPCGMYASVPPVRRSILTCDCIMHLNRPR
jgi:hypothetical protein